VKFLRQGICLLVLGGGLAAVPGLTATAAPSPSADHTSLVQKLKDDADGSVRISTDKATGKVSFVRAGLNGDLFPGSSASAAKKADAYLTKYAAAFGASRAQLQQSELSQHSGGTTISYEQKYHGIPVFGALLRVHLDDEGDLTAVNGELVPTGSLSTETRLDKAEAGGRALRLVQAQPPAHDGGKADLTGIEAKSATLLVYRHGLVQGVRGKTELAYQVEVTNERNVRDMVFVSATTGKIVNRYSMVDDALERHLYEADEDRNLTEVWAEGDALPGTLNEDQASMVESTGDAYWFFSNAFGRDSYDGAGAAMHTINNDPAISCPNANWNGLTTNYCDGVSSDDVVAHEWGHAYTEYTHGLIYQWQSGALNEGYSDVWGETVDLINGRLDEGEGILTKKRPIGLCSKYTRGDIGVTINSPEAVAGPCAAAAAASFGPVFDKTGVTCDMVVGQDTADDGSPTNGCGAFTNAAGLSQVFARA
jgi:Zn-dependent metalloprotease